jgi:hypothetical protein
MEGLIRNGRNNAASKNIITSFSLLVFCCAFKLSIPVTENTKRIREINNLCFMLMVFDKLFLA